MHLLSHSGRAGVGIETRLLLQLLNLHQIDLVLVLIRIFDNLDLRFDVLVSNCERLRYLLLQLLHVDRPDDLLEQLHILLAELGLTDLVQPLHLGKAWLTLELDDLGPQDLREELAGFWALLCYLNFENVF